MKDGNDLKSYYHIRTLSEPPHFASSPEFHTISHNVTVVYYPDFRLLCMLAQCTAND